MDLKKYIGETTYYDKKEKLEEKKYKSWLKSVSAFANTKGGKLLFGIDNDENLIGLDNVNKNADKISDIIKTKLDPIPETQLDIIEEDNKKFIMLSIPEGRETPYYLIQDGSRIAYIRIGNESVTATSSQLNNLVLKGMNRTFDTISTPISKDNASFSKFRSIYYQRTGSELLDTDLFSFGLVDYNNNLTNAGALFADERFIYQSRIFATRWNGLDKTNGLLEAFDDKEFEGSLLHLLQSGEDFIKINSKKMWKKGTDHRIEYPDYPERAVQEALVNALIHRDYGETGSEIHIDMYDDRLEIHSPGGMIDGTLIQEQNLLNIISKRRNPIIADAFNRMNLMERRGSGLKKIIDTYNIQENYNESLKPEFHSTSSTFFIILKNLNYNNEKVAITDEKMAITDEKVAITDEKVAITDENNTLKIAEKQKNIILSFASERESFKTKEIEELLGIKSARARQLLSNLVNENFLESLGQNRNRRYRIKNI